MDRISGEVSRLIMAQPDVERVFVQIGVASGGGFGIGGSDMRNGTVTVVLKDKRRLDTEGFKAAIRPLVRAIPDVRVTTAAAGFGATDIEEVLASQDAEALDKAQLELEREMRTIPQLSDIRPSPPPPGPELVIRPKPVEAARLGVNAQALSQVLRIATIGDIDANVAKFSEGERRIPIRVRLPESARADMATLANLQVPVAGGKTTTLDSVADLSFQAGPGRIVRYDRERRVSVQASLNGISLGDALNTIKKLPVMQHLPRGVHLAEQGDAQTMAELFGGIVGAMAAGVAMIYPVLVLLVGSFI
jgi:HAE1 family hydrophobic/amphiphilic exporter-1